MSFFPFRGPPWTPKPRKTRGFLIAPRWNSGTPRGPKHRKTRCFLTPWAEYTVNYIGFCEPEVTPRWPPPGSAAGAARHYNLRLPTEGLRQGHGSPWQWPAPGFKGLRLTAGRRPKGGYVGPMFASLAPIAALCCPYVSPMLALCSPMLALCWPKLALGWPKLALC